MMSLMRYIPLVSDSNQYNLLRSDLERPKRRSKSNLRSSVFRILKKHQSFVPEGHLPLYVGDKMKRFVVSAELLNHPVFIGLLNRTAQEYGHEQQGVLRIHCNVIVFEKIMESLRLGIPVSSNLIGDDKI